MSSNKEIPIKAIREKGLHNSLISLYYNIGRALPFTAQRFPDGRVSDWYRSQYVEVHKVKPSGKGGQYGDAFAFYYRNGERANSTDDPNYCWCKIDDTEPQPVPCGACGLWVLLDILGEPTQDPVKVLGLEDVFERGKHKGEKVIDVIHKDWNWIKWANEESDFFFFDIDAVISEHQKDVRILRAEDTFPFGKYQGKTIRDVAEENPNYLRWVNENSESVVIDIKSLFPEENAKRFISAGKTCTHIPS